MTSFVIGLLLSTSPSFAEEGKDPKKESTEKKTKKKSDTSKKKVEKKKSSSQSKDSKSKVQKKKGNDASINTISPNKVKDPKQTHSTSTPSRRTSTSTEKKTPSGGSRDTSTISKPKKDSSTTTRRRRRRTSTSGTKTSTATAAAGIATAAVGMAALALIPTKTKRMTCPFNKARFGIRGGSQLSQPEEDAFGGGVAIGYRWCSPFAVDLSYVHFGDGFNANAPIQASLQTFLFSSLVSPYVTVGGSVAYANEEAFYGPHGGIGTQILIKTGKSVAAVNLEGRYAQYLNENAPQESQLQGILGVDFYF